MDLLTAMTTEIEDIIEVNSEDADVSGLLDRIDLWPREHLIKVKTLIDYALMEKKIKEQESD